MESLPENVIDEILLGLPTKSAAQTAALSRSFLRRWLSIPNLDLTDVPNQFIPRIIDLNSGPIHHLKSPSLPPPPLFAFLRTLHLQSLRIPSSALSSPSRLSSLIPHSPFLDSLTVGISHGHLLCDVFACEFPRLAELRLSDCDLEFLPPDLGAELRHCLHRKEGLRGLRMLELERGEFYGELERVLRVCGEMEVLRMVHVGLGGGGQWVEVVGESLRWVEFVEVLGLKGLVVKSVPVMQRLVVDCRVGGGGGGGERGEGNLMKLLGGVDCVKKVKLGSGVFEFLRSGCIPQRLPITFNHLRCLSLGVDFGDVQDLLVVLCLLRSAPNLLELKFEGSFYNSEVLGDGQDFWEAQENVDLLEKLKTLKLVDIMGVEAELDFIQFILAKAKVLEKMIISFHSFARNKQLVMEKLMEFSMVSNQIKVLCP